MLPQMHRKEKRDEWKREMAARCARPDFAARLLPLLPRASNGSAPSECSVELVRALSTGRVTLRYEVAGFGTVYGKAYHEASLGRSTYDLLGHLWQNGFGPRSKNQVPQPLGFIAEDNLMLLRQAPGVCLASLLWTAPLDQALQSVRAAAEWLAQFHATEIPSLSAEPPCERMEIIKIADALANVAAEWPECARLLIDLLHQLRSVAERSNSLPRLAPLHGQYRPLHVFVDEETTVVTGLNKIRLSDPAKDVGRFIAAVKKSCFKAGRDTIRAELAANEFVKEYGSLAPANLENLAYFRALYGLRAFAKLLRSGKVGEQERERIQRYYQEEFERCLPEGGGTLGRTLAVRKERPVAAIGGTNETGILERTGTAASQPRDAAWGRSPTSGKMSKEDLAEKAVPLTSAEFVQQRLAPLVNVSFSSARFEAEIEQNTGTGRLTLRYVLNADTILHAKLYTDQLGARCYAAMKALWKSSFGEGSPRQVPEPVGFLPDYNLLVMRQVPGKCLGAALAGDDSIDLVEGSRDAAHWLAALHRSPLRLGTPEPDWSSLKLFRVSSRLIKAAAARPDQLDKVRDFLDQLEQRIRRMPERHAVVLTHGRYHHDHVFISPGVTAVIDLDRCSLSNPGKDAAEFVRILRLAAFKRRLDWKRVEDATHAFLQEYLSQMPDAALTLGCYWATFMFHSLLGGLKKCRDKEKRTWSQLMEFYATEIEQALEFGR